MERALLVTEAQARVLHDLQAAVTEAEGRLRLYSAAILDGHGISRATLCRVDGQPDGSKVLVVTLSENEHVEGGSDGVRVPQEDR